MRLKVIRVHTDCCDEVAAEGKTRLHTDPEGENHRMNITLQKQIWNNERSVKLIYKDQYSCFIALTFVLR